MNYNNEAGLKLNSVELSNNTIQQRITEMSTDINEQVVMKIQSSKYGFAIQLDETTDMSSCVQLLAFERYATKDSIRSKSLLGNELRTVTRGENVFELVDNFFKENGCHWSKLVGCTTDGALAMLGRKSWFQACVKAVSPSVISVHGFMHRFALAAKLLPPNVKTSLNFGC